MTDDIPKSKDILLPFLKSLVDGKEQSIHTVTDRLAAHFNLSQKALRKRYLHSGELIFFNMIRFARLRLAKAFLINSPRRGFVQISPQGKEWLQDNQEAQVITSKQLTTLSNQAPTDNAEAVSQPEITEQDDNDPFSNMDKAYGQIHAKLKFDLYSSIMQLRAFLFRKNSNRLAD